MIPPSADRGDRHDSRTWYLFCKRGVFWLMSWQGFAAINLTSMASSLAFGVYAFTLLDGVPDHVDCVSSYTCPQAYDPCPVPTDVFGVNHNMSFNCAKLGCVSKPRAGIHLHGIHSSALLPVLCTLHLVVLTAVFGKTHRAC